jgi:hypothetical protein
MEMEEQRGTATDFQIVEVIPSDGIGPEEVEEEPTTEKISFRAYARPQARVVGKKHQRS